MYLKVEFGSVRMGTALAFNRFAVGFRVDNGANFHPLLLQRFVD